MIEGRNTSGIQETEGRDDLPLYKRDKSFLSLQIMDKETLSYLRAQTKIQQVDIKTLYEEYEPFTWEEIEKFIPAKEWFSLKTHYQSIHGVNHLTRVLLNARVLAQIQGLDENETKIVSVAAGIHDICRLDDRNDNAHGQRAGRWLKDNYRLLEARGIVLTSDEIEQISVICEGHEQVYENIPAEVREKYGKTLDVLMHADMMDRYRLHKTKWWPQDSFIRLESSRNLLGVSKYNCFASEGYCLFDGMEAQQAIRKAATETGVLTAEEKCVGGVTIEMNALSSSWATTKNMLDRLVQLKNGHTLSPESVKNYPCSPLNRTIYGERIPSEQNPLINLFENDPISKNIDPIEVAWQHFLVYDTPNGQLFKQNRLFDQVKRGNGLTLVHATPSLDKIVKEGVFYSSGGCLGASVYAVPLRVDATPHNLTRFVMEQQIPGNPEFIKGESRVDLVLFDILPENFDESNFEENWLDYLRFGEIQGMVFKRLVDEGIFTQDVVVKIQQQVYEQVDGARHFLDMCYGYSLDSISDQDFENEFNTALSCLPILGYVLFETMLEFIALHQNDVASIALAQQGELNTYNYYKVVYDLCPQLYHHFRLQQFRPSLSQISDYLREKSQQGEMITNFSPEYFFTFMKWRMAQQTRRKIMGSQPLPPRGSSIFDYMDINPSLVGHIVHRDLRKDLSLRDQHQQYEYERAEAMWNYWTEKKILVPFNALLPKGEMGINPRFPGLKYELYHGYLYNGKIIRGERLNIRYTDQISTPELSVLRVKSDARRS